MMKLNHEAVVEFVEAAYARGDDEGEWKRGLAESAFRLVGCADGFGLLEYRWRRDEVGDFRITDVVDVRHFGKSVVWGEGAKRMHMDAAPDVAERISGRTGAMPASTQTGASVVNALFRACWKPPIEDVLGIVACEPSGSGIACAVGARERLVLSPRARSVLNRVAFHLAAGFRLRLSGRTALDDAEAILAPDGRLLHALDTAKAARDSLDVGRRRRDQAKKTRHDAEKALEIWQGLVAGRWSLVDHFDTDGKRFLLAMKNTPKVDRRADLTPRERRVSALVAMGHRDKEIAYILGLSTPSVTSALHRARKKLNVRSRLELARIWRSAGPIPGD
jgi:DNA-binding CsgD family transcriptional regulator